MPDLVGQTLLGRYRIEELVGRGGMAEVYRAWDTRRQYHVAIKVMREDLAEDLEFLRRFKREAQALAALSHANIVRFYSFERERHLAFIVMDFVPGTTLRRRTLEAEGTPLPLDEVLSVTQQVCAALHYAHEENVLHRDVKPGNVMIQPDGRVLLSDFGIAKAADAATATTVMPGTPAYMSPEQCRSEPLDVRTDVYSLGVVVYEMLAGRRPFVGEQAPDTVTGGTRERIRWEHMHAAPPSLRQFNPTLPRGAEQVVLQALGKEREERWPSALVFWWAFEEAVEARVPEAAAVVQEALVPELGIAVPAAPVVEPAKPEPELGSPVPSEQGAVAEKPVTPSVAKPLREPRPAAGGGRVPMWAWALGALVVLVTVATAFSTLRPASSDTVTSGDDESRSLFVSPDGTILFTSDRDGKREIYRFTTGKPIQAIHTPDDDQSWSPVPGSGGTVLFTSDRDGKREVYRLTEGGVVRVTHTPGNGESWSPALAPSGTLYFTSDRDGRREVYRLTEGGVVRVTHTPGHGESWSPALAANGTLLFTSDRDGKREIYRFTTGKPVQVTHTPGDGESWSPALAPSGTLLFTSDRDGKREIYRFTTGKPVQVTHTPGDGESWSPALAANSTLLFTSDRDGKREIYRFTTGKAVQVTHTPGDGESWLPAQ